MKSGFAPAMGEITVLFVDDSPDVRFAYGLEASAAGFRFELATDGHEALAMALHLRPDVVVTEALLYGLDGFELTRLLAMGPHTRSIPVIMITALSLLNLPARARAVGCSAVLRKPCSFLAIERTIRRVLREAADASAQGAVSRVDR